jgi:GTP cyclohydrolase III
VITTGSITATVAVDTSRDEDGLSSNLVNSDGKSPIDAKRTGRKGRKEIGGGRDEDRERTLSAIAAVNPVTSQWIAYTHLPAKRPTRGKPQQVKAHR